MCYFLLRDSFLWNTWPDDDVVVVQCLILGLVVAGWRKGRKEVGSLEERGDASNERESGEDKDQKEMSPLF